MPDSTKPMRAAALFALAAFSLPANGAAQSAEQSYYEAYYLHHEQGDLKAALELYERVAASDRAPAELRERARRMARSCTEELACSDFARLAPANAIFYVELNRPGDQLRGLFDQLGLLADETGGERGGSLGISPRLLDGVLGLRGMAVAITDIDPRRGPTGGVAILHPGDMDIARGLLETALPVGGRAVEPIEGCATYSIDGKALVAMTPRLLIASASRESIAEVIARAAGGGPPSLADSEALRGALDSRRDDLLFFCVNGELVMPMVQQLIQHQIRRQPELGAALAFLDLESTSSLSGRAGVDEHGLSCEISLGLKAGHRNLLFDLLRLPALDKRSLEMVPEGVACFLAGSVNRHGEVPAGVTGAGGRPVVTLMDFGRELFANIADVAVYAWPAVDATPAGPVPQAALAMRVNDPGRTRAVWELLLGTAQAATGGGPAPQTTAAGEAAITRYAIEGVPVFLATHGDDVMLSPSQRAIEASIEARAAGRSVLVDPALARALESFPDGGVRIAAINVGRASEVASSFMSERERREMAPIAGVLRETTASIAVLQDDRRLTVSARLVGIPDVGPMVTQLVQRRMRSGGQRVSAAPSPPPQPSLLQQFEALHAAEQYDAARAVADRMHQDQRGDANALNDFAWALLTEERFGDRYGDLALAISRTSNERTAWNNWFCLDTYALALFKSGEVDEAIELERKAIELAGDHPQASGAQEQLERFLAAKKKGIVRR